MLKQWIAGLVCGCLCVFVVGCGPAEDKAKEEQKEEAHGAHAHPTEGPRGGHLIELGEEEYHAELLHDEETHTVSVFLLDASGKKAVDSKEEEVTLVTTKDGTFADYTLTAGDETGEFTLVGEELCDFMCHSDVFKGRLRVTIDGTEYVGHIDYRVHGDCGHDHGDDGHSHGDGGHSHGEGDAHDHDGDDHSHGEAEGHDHDGHAGHDHSEADHRHDEDDGHSHDESDDHSHDHDGDDHADHDHGDADHAHD